MAAAERIPRLLDRFPATSPPARDGGASVLIVLREGSSDVEVLLIERSVRAGDPASGQVALPGGHVEPGDADLAGAALRELEEEVGLGASDLAGPIRHVGTLEARRFGLSVGVFAGALASRSTTPLRGNPREVAATFWLPLGAVAGAVVLEGDRSPIAAPVRAVLHEGHVLWGFTLRALEQLEAPTGVARGSAAQAPAEDGFVPGGLHGASSQPS